MSTLYKNAMLLDGTQNMTLKENVSILVDNGRIVSVLAPGEPAKAIEVIDLKGSYVIPGLINLHVHTPATGYPSTKKKKGESESQYSKAALMLAKTPVIDVYAKMVGRKTMQTQLYSGTTTIRAVGGLHHVDSTMRDDIDAGTMEGPRMKVCDVALTVPKGHMEGVVSLGLTKIEDFEKAVEQNAKAGVDWIKVMITGGVLDAKVKGEPGEIKMEREQIEACCRKAHELGLKVCAHVESPQGIELALDCGVDSIEHGAYMTEQTADRFLQNQAVLVCTLSPAIPLSKFPQELVQASETTVYNSNVLLEGIISGTKTALKKGVTVGLGTDTACPFITHYDMWRELEYFHRLIGVSREEALYTATCVNARILGLEQETGTIEPGKSADFVVIKENPLDGFAAIAQPEMVVFRGRQIRNPKIEKNAICEQALNDAMSAL